MILENDNVSTLEVQPSARLSSGRLWASLCARSHRVGFSLADQALSSGGLFVANVALARAVSKEEYGVFALAYSGFNFLAGLHNAIILEPFTVHGAGRYQASYSEYRWHMWKSNGILSLALTLLLTAVWFASRWKVSLFASRSLLGLALGSAPLLTFALGRRLFYVERKVRLAAMLSFFFFVALCISLVVLRAIGILNSMTTFFVFGIGSLAGLATVMGGLPGKASRCSMHEVDPSHWKAHWGYSRWVIGTAFVFQFTNQAYYWLVAAFLSVPEVAELRAMLLIVMLIDQVFTAMGLIVLPMMAERYALRRITDLLSLGKTYLLILLAIGGTFAVIIVVFGNSILHVAYSGKFDDGAQLLRLLVALPLLMGIGSVMNLVMKAAEKPNVVLYAYLASGAATFAIGIPLMLHFGFPGAVYGLLISGGVFSAALGVGFIRLLPRLNRLNMAHS